MRLCEEGEIGEIWVSSEANVLGYMGKYMSPLIKDHFYASLDPARLPNSPTYPVLHRVSQISFARTGDYGFLHHLPVHADHDFKPGYEPQVLFFLAKEKWFMEESMTFFSGDVEATIEASHEGLHPPGW
jgi:acyl-CoA synthetase (AMP-forming)/AMP-acid ligase II